MLVDLYLDSKKKKICVICWLVFSENRNIVGKKIYDGGKYVRF